MIGTGDNVVVHIESESEIITASVCLVFSSPPPLIPYYPLEITLIYYFYYYYQDNDKEATHINIRDAS